MAWAELWKSLATYNGGQLLVVLAIVIIVTVSIWARGYLAPGTERLARYDNDRNDAIGILKAENVRLVQEKDEAEKEARKERHRANNLEQELNGFQWAWKNPMALRQRADDLEQMQKEQKQDG